MSKLGETGLKIIDGYVNNGGKLEEHRKEYHPTVEGKFTYTLNPLEEYLMEKLIEVNKVIKNQS